jgi:hypothetical protein
MQATLVDAEVPRYKAQREVGQPAEEMQATLVDAEVFQVF